MEKLTAAAARRLALAAQGFTQPRPASAPDAGHVRRTIERLGLLQINSVNILVRSHYLPLFSRLGPYQRDLLDRLAYARRGRSAVRVLGSRGLAPAAGPASRCCAGAWSGLPPASTSGAA